ncbi:MAG: peroxide stress protein YaaA [Firmicutes bacterium]|nr:peroxide stress protein YaaA [Bacillota bacterium]
MRIIISPAKKMNMDTDSLDFTSLPQFLPEAETIKCQLQAMNAKELQALWRCNDSIAALNLERLRGMDLQKNLTPAILAYEGLQYRYMAPGVFERGHYAYIDEHLRILSGFYGLLRTFDGVVPYRLEMQAKLSVAGSKDLYDYWGDRLAKQLAAETDLILNLASKEYSQAVKAGLPVQVRWVECIFAEGQDGKLVQKGTRCKMARGQMVRFLAEHNITSVEEIKAFAQLGYVYSQQHSSADRFVFIKEAAAQADGR